MGSETNRVFLRNLQALRRLPARAGMIGRATLACVLALCMLQATAQTAPPPAATPFTDAGEVVFVAGAVTVTRPAGTTTALRKGDRVEEGDSFVAEADGYAYIRLRDQGLLVLRPQTHLSIDTWRYDPARPELSQIHYTLVSGVARHVSGLAAKAARDKFRFNTPVAAIGVRGTDFTVLAEGGLTRVSVRSGGVIVSGLGDGCRADGLGPCEGAGSLELFANVSSTRDKMLQFRGGDSRPELVDINNSSPDRARPPATGEPVAGKGASSVQDVAIAEVRTGKLKAPLGNTGGDGGGTETGGSGPIDVVPPAPPMPPEMPKLAVWGRWAALAGQSAPVPLADIRENRALVARNGYYALAANPAALMEMPGTGVVDFMLTAHDGYFVDSKSGKSTASTASNGTLRIDFGTKRFQTDLDLTAGGASAHIQATGAVDKSGIFAGQSTDFGSNITGVVGNQGSEAAYIYQRKLSDRLTAVGATSWRK